MLWINVKRIFHTGFVQFWRNGVVSLSAVLVMIVTLLVIGMVIFTSALLTDSLSSIEEKVDVNVYFVTDASEEDVFSVKASLESLPEVDAVEYVSREQALVNFRERHENDEKTLEALDELDDNPLGAVLNIKAKEPSQYEGVANFLDQNYPTNATDSLVERVNYFQNKQAIDRLGQIIDAGERLGAIITVIFIIISIVITLNTIRLAMYISRDEISVMKLVGASQKYITGPFIVTGAMYGIVSSILTLIIFWPLTFWLGPITERFFVNINLFEYYVSSFFQIFIIIFLAGVLIGSVSSFLAIKRYLKVR
ncbi:permease-like cell division protein FtsX [Candidatus Pacebacteria bacterium]|nr:permease-like cell division protein FtsX [Candidatus Paceibacterota bacterium]